MKADTFYIYICICGNLAVKVTGNKLVFNSYFIRLTVFCCTEYYRTIQNAI